MDINTFSQQVRDELAAMVEVGACSKRDADAAMRKVGTLDDSMSVGEAASLALQLAAITNRDHDAFVQRQRERERIERCNHKSTTEGTCSACGVNIEQELCRWIEQEINDVAPDMEAAVGAKRMRSAMQDHIGDRTCSKFDAVERTRRHKLIREIVRRYF